MAKPRVTRRVHVKKPWYERPTLLFIVLILVLGIGGILVSRLMGGGGGGRLTPLGAPARPDTTSGASAGATSAPATPPGAGTEEMTGILLPGTPLPVAEPGMVLPPIEVATIGEAAGARRALRRARGAGAESPSAFVEGARLVDASAAGATPAFEALPLRTEQRSFCDFELTRAMDGDVYLTGFVSVEVARAIAALGPSLRYPAAGEEPPGWQVWKKRSGGKALALRVGSEVTLFPDLSPEATCIVQLPLRHLQPLRIRRVEIGLAQPAEVLEAALR